jgi:hypothetical protein
MNHPRLKRVTKKLVLNTTTKSVTRCKKKI